MGKGKEIKAGGGFVTLDVRNRLQKGLRAASAQLKAFGASATAMGGAIAGAGLGIVGPIMAAVGVFTTLGDQVDKVSARTGLSAEAVSELGYAASTSGASIEALEKGNAKLGDSIDDALQGSKTAAEGFARLGLSAEQLATMNQEEKFYAVADALSKVEDMAERGALAQQLLGKSGRQLLPMLAGGAAGIEEMRKHARELGYTITQDAAASAAELGDRLAELWQQLKMVAFTIGAAVADDLIDFVTASFGVVRSVIDWIKANKTLISVAFRVGAVLAVIGTAIVGLGLTFSVIGAAIGAIVPIVGFLFTPLGALIAILAVAGVVFFRFTETGRKALQSFIDYLKPFVEIFKRSFKGIFDAISAGDWALAGKIAIAGLKSAVLLGLAALSSAIGGAMGDVLGTVVGQIAGGDLSGAWSTVVLQMASLWDGFAEGIVSVFTGAARAVVDIWKNATTAISQQILALAANDGIIGKAFSHLLGVDVAAEVERSRKLGTGDFLANTQAAAGDQIANQADALRAQLDDFDRQATLRTSKSTQALKDRTRGGVDQAAAAAAEANAELEQLIKHAAEQRKAAEAERRESIGDAVDFDELPDPAEAAATAKTETAGTFSGVAANLIAGATKRPIEEKIAAGVQAIAADAKKIARGAERGIAFG